MSAVYVLDFPQTAGLGALEPPPEAVPPSITTQPTSRSATDGAPTTFSVVAAGTGPLSYQWRRAGVNIAGATSATYTRTAVLADNGVAFSVVVTNGQGSATSSNAVLTVVSNTVFPFPEQGASESVLLDASKSFQAQTRATFNFVDSDGSYGLTGGGGTNLVNISDANGFARTDGSKAIQRASYPPAPSTRDAFRLNFRNSDNTTTSSGFTERTQIEWYAAFGGTPLAAMIRYNTDFWMWIDCCFSVTGTPPSEILFFQMHANSDNASWARYSPPFALYRQQTSPGVQRIVCRLHTVDSITRKGQGGTGQPGNVGNTITVVPSLADNERFVGIWRGKMGADNTCTLTLYYWVGSGAKQTLVLRTGGNVMFPHDSVEVAPDGSWTAARFATFATVSIYDYIQPYPTDYTLDLFVANAGHRPHAAGITEDSLFAKISSTGKF